MRSQLFKGSGLIRNRSFFDALKQVRADVSCIGDVPAGGAGEYAEILLDGRIATKTGANYDSGTEDIVKGRRG